MERSAIFEPYSDPLEEKLTQEIEDAQKKASEGLSYPVSLIL
jgi:hypothetical protein